MQIWGEVMGLLVDGQWQDKWYDTEDGSFKREATEFHDRITPDGEPGPDGQKAYKAQSGRYHLFVSLACPWAHRTLIMRKLKGLDEHISVSVVDPKMLEHGWEFSDVTHNNPLGELDYLYEVYQKAKSDYTGRVTVPVLWDTRTGTIVNNESSEIIRIFNTAFNEITGNTADYYPEPLREQIDELNARVYSDINNGVYKTGFATKQEVYELHYTGLWAALDWVEGILSTSRYLCGDQLTEADIRLFTTLIRFDAVYHGHFKCNRQRIEDYPYMARYVREIFQDSGIYETVDFEHIQTHYYFSHTMINPNQIVPMGPLIDYMTFKNG